MPPLSAWPLMHRWRVRQRPGLRAAAASELAALRYCNGEFRTAMRKFAAASGANRKHMGGHL